MFLIKSLLQLSEFPYEMLLFFTSVNQNIGVRQCRGGLFSIVVLFLKTGHF